MKLKLVVAHFCENLDWIQRVRGYDQICVVSKTDPNAFIFQGKNLGFEASAFFEYIVNEYDTLSDYTVFVHGHETSWHHVGKMDELANVVAAEILREKRLYRNINGGPKITVYTPPTEILESFNETLRNHDLELYGSRTIIRPCAMFYVHRCLIKRNSKSTYSKLLDTSVNSHKEGSSKKLAMVFEYLWFKIFTGQDDEVRWDEDSLRLIEHKKKQDDLKPVPTMKYVVTPAGRRRYLEILYEHLSKQKKHFDKWLLLVNTNNIQDIGFCERLAAKNEDWIETCYADGSDPNRGNLNIHRFLNQFCSDEDSVYLRLDDDIVYLSPDFVKNMFECREKNPDHFLIYANIINNAITSWIHQKSGAFAYDRQSGYACMDDVGWRDGGYAEMLHRAFLEDPTDDKWKIKKWILTEYERMSINGICWFGRDIKAAPVQEDEEKFLSCDHPRGVSRTNVICGDAICVHFAFGPQRDHLDRLDILEKYKHLSLQRDV
jgi:hypothetical protein